METNRDGWFCLLDGRRYRPGAYVLPIFHLMMPVVIGAALILRRRRESALEADLAAIQVG